MTLQAMDQLGIPECEIRLGTQRGYANLDLHSMSGPWLLMDSIFSDRISDVPRSFIREILKVALQPSMISFAGGLPNPVFFPQDELIAATSSVYAQKGRDIFHSNVLCW